MTTHFARLARTAVVLLCVALDWDLLFGAGRATAPATPAAPASKPSK